MGCLQSSSDTTCSGTGPEDDFQVTLEVVMMTSASQLSYRAVPTFEIYIPIIIVFKELNLISDLKIYEFVS